MGPPGERSEQSTITGEWGPQVRETNDLQQLGNGPPGERNERSSTTGE